MCATSLPKHLILAYTSACYKVLVDPPFSFRIGKNSPQLMKFLALQKSSKAAFITAYNPHSLQLPPDINLIRQKQLRATLHKKSLKFFEGCSSDPKTYWPEEPSFLILSISQPFAISLGKQFDQNAIVWIETNCLPELITLV